MRLSEGGTKSDSKENNKVFGVPLDADFEMIPSILIFAITYLDKSNSFSSACESLSSFKLISSKNWTSKDYLESPEIKMRSSNCAKSMTEEKTLTSARFRIHIKSLVF